MSLFSQVSVKNIIVGFEIANIACNVYSFGAMLRALVFIGLIYVSAARLRITCV